MEFFDHYIGSYGFFREWSDHKTEQVYLDGIHLIIAWNNNKFTYKNENLYEYLNSLNNFLDDIVLSKVKLMIRPKRSAITVKIFFKILISTTFLNRNIL